MVFVIRMGVTAPSRINIGTPNARRPTPAQGLGFSGASRPRRPPDRRHSADAAARSVNTAQKARVVAAATTRQAGVFQRLPPAARLPKKPRFQRLPHEIFFQLAENTP